MANGKSQWHGRGWAALFATNHSLLALARYCARGIFGRNTASSPIAGRKAQTW
jgi:hypothetical protein